MPPAFYIRQGSSGLFSIVDREGMFVCGVFNTYSIAHEHCENEHGEVIGDWAPNEG